MRLLMTVIDPGSEPPVCRDVLIDAPAGAAFADVVDDLRRLVGCTDTTLGFRVGRQVLDRAQPLGEPPLLRGAILTLDRPTGAGMPSTPGAVVDLEVVSGPGAGRVVPLARGVSLVGRGAGCAVRLADRTVSRHHLELSVTSAGVTIRNLAPTNGSRLGGTPLQAGPVPFPPGDRLQIGSTTLTHRIRPTRPAATTVMAGRRQVHRPPRFCPERPPARIEFPIRPTKPERNRLPLIAALLPMVLSLLLALVLRSPVMMLFALLTPAMLLGQWWSDRRHGRVSYRRRLIDHEKHYEAAEARLAAALERERLQRHEDAPDLAVTTAVVTGVEARLWERRAGDPDFLALRLGVGPQPALTTVVGEGADLPGMPSLDVPAVVHLADVGVLGVAGPRTRALALTSSLVGQLCAWHSPRHVRVVILTAHEAGQDSWAWALLLPHAASVHGTCLAAMGDHTHEGSVGRRVAELAGIVAARMEDTAHTAVTSDLVVVLDGSERLRREPGVADLLRDGPAVGVQFVCLDRDATRLPVEAAAQVLIGDGPAAEARYDHRGGTVNPLVPDLPDPAWAEALARALAPLEDATPVQDGPVLPERVDFVELHRLHSGADVLDASSLARLWSGRRHRPTALLGLGDGGPVVVDLVADGPHALVGGTTGAGKSELLQTLVASLAVHSPPTELSFVLIDYKGGSAFHECADLPHVLGVVTDLDEHLTARALTSLGAELKRRERLLAQVGAKDLDDYRRLAPAHERLARLVLVVDEFKVLADELPDFVSGLVRLAAVGRSLGVHLVLATQRPAGIVSADMRANVSLRIALRVRDRADSDDVIEAPDAARIPDRLPGRAYLRVGSRPLVPVQVAHAGRPDTDQAGPGAQPITWPIGWGDVMASPPRAGTGPGSESGPPPLGGVAAAVIEAAARLDARAPASPWLPPLPDALPASDRRLTGTEASQAVPLGLADRPSEQRQAVLTWDPARDGHLGIAGGARTGRTTAVLAIALRLSERFAPSQVHLHAMEGSPGSLACLSALPNSGSITGTSDPGRLRRAIQRLCEQRHRAGLHTIVLIDGWEPITQALDDLDQGESTERLIGLVRDGLARGIHVIVTGGRQVASGRLGGLLQRRLVLDMPDPVDLTLAGLSPAAAARHRPAGRALDVLDEAEVQLGLPGDDVSDDPASLAGSVAARSAKRWGPVSVGAGPWRLLPLPDHVMLDGLPRDPQRLLVGVGGDDLAPVGFDLERDERRILVLGPPRTGKSTLLGTLLTQLLDSGRHVALVAPRRSPLADAPPRLGLHVLAREEHDRFIALRREHTDLTVLVDDADLLDGTPLESALVEATRLVESASGVVVVTLDSRRTAGAFRGLVPEVARAGAGVLLCPNSSADGDLLRIRVDGPSARTPGRGLLVTDGLPVPVQVAVSDPAATAPGPYRSTALPYAAEPRPPVCR
ncbi:MAG: FHA domain-containing protein [Intrasporangium sp.]|uniref:FtsK/SpoIIIE domain-containing protein n=1 Tax=Intrasporangium sp. TaxID=1925024 RepID=UPI002647043B|nr:FtsK/SpoIIIE domain-containing protein [Intrasporangium sp.]MDN5796666.1 FHA domain-containing protein [Intrasporangium sp.]